MKSSTFWKKNQEQSRVRLWRAIAAGDVLGVEAELRMGLNPNFKSLGGSTPLCSAIESNAGLETVLALLRHGADPNYESEAYGMPLHVAASRMEYGGEVNVLLDAGADASALFGFRTALELALLSGRRQAAMILSNRDLYEKPIDELMPDAVFFAVKGGVETLRLALECGFSADARNEEGYSPLHWAAVDVNSEAICELLAAGASPNAKAKTGGTPLDSLFESSSERFVEASECFAEMLLAGCEFGTTKESKLDEKWKKIKRSYELKIRLSADLQGSGSAFGIRRVKC